LSQHPTATATNVKTHSQHQTALRAVDAATLRAEKKLQREQLKSEARQNQAQEWQKRQEQSREHQEEANFRAALELSMQAEKEDEARRLARFESARATAQFAAATASAAAASASTSPPLLKRNSSGRFRASAHPLPTHSWPSHDKEKKSTSMARCPVCDVLFPIAQVDSHLDNCLTEKALQDDPNLTRTHSGGSAQDLLQEMAQPGTGTPNSKKRHLEGDHGDEESSYYSPATKKPADPSTIDNDCVIIGESGFDPKRSYYYSEDDEMDDYDSLDEDEELESRFRDRHRRDSELRDGNRPILPVDGVDPLHASAPSVFSATPTTVSVSPSRPTAAPLSPPLTTSTAATARMAISVPAVPHVVIPNSGGMFNVVQFNTAQDSECPICFEEFQPGHIGIRLPCLCLYHDKCITSWLERKPHNCPSHGDY